MCVGISYLIQLSTERKIFLDAVLTLGWVRIDLDVRGGGDVSLARRCPLRDPDQSCGTCKWCVSLARPLGVLGGSIVIELASQGGN